MIKKIFKTLLIISIFLQNFVLACTGKIAFIDTEPISNKNENFLDISYDESEMLISLMEGYMKGNIVACKRSDIYESDYIKFKHHQNDEIIYTQSIVEAYSNLMKLLNFICDCLEKNNSLNINQIYRMTPNTKLYLQGLRFFDFINCLDIIKSSSGLYKLLAKKYRKNLFISFRLKYPIAINQFIKFSTYSSFISLEKDIDQLILDITNENLEKNNLLGKSINKKRLKKLEISKKLKSLELKLQWDKIEAFLKQNHTLTLSTLQPFIQSADKLEHGIQTAIRVAAEENKSKTQKIKKWIKEHKKEMLLYIDLYSI